MYWTRKKIIIAIIVLAAVVAGILIFYLWRSQTRDTSKELGPGSVNKTRVLTYQAPELTEAEKNSLALTNISRSFAERFGTASSQTVELGFSELKAVMTDSFYQWAGTTYQNRLASELKSDGAYAVLTTEALAVEVSELAADKAVVIVETTRVKKMPDSDPINYKQKLTLNFLNQGGEWKVDGAYWQ
ncbi:TPA: hypothetical protein DF272_01970 [Candidatus Falkowbacteria bacterium]|nr:hypothetical protein [Candidatus Falkowbacteria bacterium]